MEPSLTQTARKIRTAVIGAGYFGSFHAAKYAGLPCAELVAVCDHQAEKASEIAARFGARAVSDHRDLLGNVDAVSIAVPLSDHYGVAHDFLAAGADVLIEKPMCSSLDEADALIDLAARGARILQVGHLERFSPIVEAIKHAAAAPIHIETRRIAPFRPRATDTSAVMDMMSHDLDHALSLTGASISTIEAEGQSLLTEHLDLVHAKLVFSNGCTAQMTASRVGLKIERSMAIVERDRYIAADMVDNRLLVTRRSHAHAGAAASAGENLPPSDNLQRQIESFLDAVTTRRQPVASGREIRPVLAAAIEIVERAEAWRRRQG
ncbi:MAG: Gfo/Idh/MocA family protein [Alphaproteobacteria bacterium]